MRSRLTTSDPRWPWKMPVTTFWRTAACTLASAWNYNTRISICQANACVCVKAKASATASSICRKRPRRPLLTTWAGAVAHPPHPCSAHQPANRFPIHGSIAIVQRWRRQVDIPDLSPHQLRHTLATQLLNVGMDITSIQKLLGHQHVTTTQIYARVYDATVEADYRKAMNCIAREQMPLSDQPLPVANWPRLTNSTNPRTPPWRSPDLTTQYNLSHCGADCIWDLWDLRLHLARGSAQAQVSLLQTVNSLHRAGQMPRTQCFACSLADSSAMLPMSMSRSRSNPSRRS